MDLTDKQILGEIFIVFHSSGRCSLMAPKGRVMYTAVVLLTLGLCSATGNICPETSVNNIHNAFGAFNYIQRGVWHQVPCLSFRIGEAITRVIWLKEDAPETDRQTLITHKHNEDHPESERYAFGASGFSLVIKGVQEGDEGRYLCHVIPQDTIDRTEEINIRVLGESFPATTSEASFTTSLLRGRRRTLPCQCASQSPDAPSVVYWSMGEGIITDTKIIGARFSDGVTLQIQHGADYSIGSDASLTVNSLNNLQNNHRFWCHVFQPDTTLTSCIIDVRISGGTQSNENALRASETSYYLRKGMQQVLPCITWKPGLTACDVEWIKLNKPEPQVVFYNLSTGVVDSSPAFDLASDLGLVIQSADDDHAGKYRCSFGDSAERVIGVRVMGEQFPLDDARATEGRPVTLKPESRSTLQCPALSGIPQTKATLIWSYGSPDDRSTTVIGTFNLPNGSHSMNSLKDNSCLVLSTEGSLLLNNCSQDGDVRYWCHVFPANSDLIRSYVLVKVHTSASDEETETSVTLVIVLLIVCSIVVLAVVAVILLIWKRRSESLRHRDDKERGSYRRVCKQDTVNELYLKTLTTKARIPVTPWTDGDLACSAPIETVYMPLKIFVNAYIGGSVIKYQLDSESHIFSDGISELANEHVIVQGRSGSGKTTCLYRLLYDWANGRERAVFGSDRMVFLFTVRVFIQARSIGEAVVENILQKDENISSASIDEHYSKDKSKLTILIDGCNDQNDIDKVMKRLKDQDLLDCQLVLTTRHAELAKDASRKYNMRHVTITGFTLKNAVDYVNAVLETVGDRKTATPEHTPEKSKTGGKFGPVDAPQSELSESEKQKEYVSLRQKKATPTEEKAETAQTQCPNKKRNLQRYLEEDILPPDIRGLPAVLAALCQMSIWTRGTIFEPNVTMANLFFRLVRFLFDKKGSLKGDDSRAFVTEGNQFDLITNKQHGILKELGKSVYSRLIDISKTLSNSLNIDSVILQDVGEEVLIAATESGLLCCLELESRVEYSRQSSGAVSLEVTLSEEKKETGCLCWMREQHTNRRMNVKYSAETTPADEPKYDRRYFVLEILRDFCVAVFLARSVENVEKLFEDMTSIGHQQYIKCFPYVLQFAVQDTQFDRDALVEHLVTNIEMGQSGARSMDEMLQVQKLLELCLQVNYEGKWDGAMNKALKRVFREGTVSIIGISSYKLRLLSYLFEQAKPENGSKLNVKSVELFRIGRYDWLELPEYIRSFQSKGKTKEKASIQADKEKSLATTTHKTNLQNKSIARVHNFSAENSIKADKHQFLEAQMGTQKPQPDVDGRQSNIGDDKSPPTGSAPKLTTSPNGGEHQGGPYQSFDVDVLSYEMIAGKKNQLALLKSLRERVESTNPDMPTFPAEQSDGSVLHTVQSMCLQELVESQGGECHTSGASRDLARYLPRLEMLESLVLVGTIFSSDVICDFAKGAHQLMNLKKLDLRLNKQFDDRAFVAVTNFPLRDCPKLSDLRLSLYKVTITGFDEVKKEMDKNKGWPWGKLENLYLLHGSPAEILVGFLSDSLRHFHHVKHFHLSATNENENIQEDILEGFVKNMTTQKIMPNLKVLSIGNMETLKKRLASLKLPKEKVYSIRQKQLGTGTGLKGTGGTSDSDTKLQALGESAK